MADGHDPQALTDEQQDGALEMGAMTLLSQVEQVAIHIEDPTVQISPALVLEYLVKATNAAVAFAETLPPATTRQLTLQSVISKDPQGYTQLQLRHIQNNRLSQEIVAELNTQQEFPAQLQDFGRRCQDLLRVLKIYLLLSVRAFHSPQMRDQWRKLFGSFFLSLTNTVEQMQANQKTS